MLEVALLQRTERAIRGGEGALALALLDELDRQVPAPRLRREVAAARVLARCVRASALNAGSPEEREARASAERFLGQDGASLYSERIRSSCPLETNNLLVRTSSEEALPAEH